MVRIQVNIGTALLKANCSPSQAAMAAELIDTLLDYIYGPDTGTSPQSTLSRVASTASLSSMQGILGDTELAAAVAAAAAADAAEAEGGSDDPNRSWYSSLWDTLADDDPYVVEIAQHSVVFPL